MSDPVIRAQSLVHRFGKTVAVDGASFEVPRGSAFGLFGTNGAGKTTTIRMLLGLLPAHSGSAQVLGFDAAARGVEIRRRTGYVPEDHHFYDWMKVRDLVRFTRAFYPTWSDEEAARLFKQFGLDESKRVKHLSKGMVAKLALALTLAHKPDLLVLDEPTGGLDPVVRREFVTSMIDMIQETGRTIFLSSHLIAEVEGLVDRIAIMKSGKILLIEDAETLKERTRRARIIFHEERAAVELPGALCVTRNGRVWEAVFADWTDELGRRLRAELKPREVEVARIGLEEIFIAYVGQSE